VLDIRGPVSGLTAIADMARLAVFVTFVVLAVRAGGMLVRTPRARRRAVGLLVAFSVLVSMTVGAMQHEMWPFTHWPMDNEYFVAEYSGLRPVVVDDKGVEHDLDLRALYPIDWMDLHTWLDRTRRRNPEAFARVAPWLLDKIARARGDLEAGRRLPGDRGPLAARPRLVLPPVWTHGDSLSPLDVKGLRIYEFHANLDEPPRAAADQPRSLVFEYIAP